MLTDEEELALAILLWKGWRGKPSGTTYGSSGGRYVSNEMEDAAYRALQLAKRFGVSEQMLRIMNDVPIMSVQVRELEAWEPNRVQETLGAELNDSQSGSKRRREGSGKKKAPWGVAGERSKPQEPPKTSSSE